MKFKSYNRYSVHIQFYDFSNSGVDILTVRTFHSQLKADKSKAEYVCCGSIFFLNCKKT